MWHGSDAHDWLPVTGKWCQQWEPFSAREGSIFLFTVVRLEFVYTLQPDGPETIFAVERYREIKKLIGSVSLRE